MNSLHTSDPGGQTLAMADAAHRVVVIGAGFGGLAVARSLTGAPVEVTVVDRNNFHTFQPLLYQVATAGLNAADVASVVRGILQRRANVDFRLGAVDGVDWAERDVLLADGGRLPFDHLVVAAGSAPAFFGVPGAQEHGFPLYSLDGATALRNHVLERFEAAAADPALIGDGALTFVVVGGGPTGVEVAGALAELVDRVLQHDFHHLDVHRARIVLVEQAPHLLGAFSNGSRRYAGSVLRRRGVEVRLEASVAEVEPTRVRLGDGEVLRAHTLVWAAGVQAGGLAASLGVPTGRGGRIAVGPDLAIEGHAEAFAIGDIADIDDGTGGRLPQLAQVAMQGGSLAAEQILADLDGRPRRAFRYRDKGSMATIGRRAAVAELPGGIHLRGTLAWGAWLGLHLIELMGFRNRLSVFLNWAWNYLTWDRGPRLIFGRR